jgi:hypothetical protein
MPFIAVRFNRLLLNVAACRDARITDHSAWHGEPPERQIGLHAVRTAKCRVRTACLGLAAKLTCGLEY